MDVELDRDVIGGHPELRAQREPDTRVEKRREHAAVNDPAGIQVMLFQIEP